MEMTTGVVIGVLLALYCVTVVVVARAAYSGPRWARWLLCAAWPVWFAVVVFTGELKIKFYKRGHG